jgi:hypothetical protein
MSVSVRRVALAAVVVAGLSVSAGAQGMFLKLATDEAKVAPDQPVKVRLTTVVTRTFPVPEPEFLIDDGTGLKVRTDVKVTAVETPSAASVLPGRPHRASWEIELPNPGQYRIRARYRMSDRIVESNKLTVEVTGAPKLAAQP